MRLRFSSRVCKHFAQLSSCLNSKVYHASLFYFDVLFATLPCSECCVLDIVKYFCILIFAIFSVMIGLTGLSHCLKTSTWRNCREQKAMAELRKQAGAVIRHFMPGNLAHMFEVYSLFTFFGQYIVLPASRD